MNINISTLGIVTNADFVHEYVDTVSFNENSDTRNDPLPVFERLLLSLNDDQRRIFEIIQYSLNHDTERNRNMFYIDGPGGSGKTYLYNTLISYVASMNGYCISSAYTGIASSLLQNGATIHKRFSIPIDGEHNSTLSISPSSAQADFIRNAKLFIFDEATMIPSWMLDYIDRLLRDIMDVNEPFGGKIVIFGGDFRQCLPVISRGDKAMILSSCIRASGLWNEFKVLQLTQNMRARNSDSSFRNWLLDIGNGRTGPTIDIPSECFVPSERILIHRVFENNLGPHSAKQIVNRCILCVDNNTVNRMNESIISLFPGRSKIYHSVDSVVNPDSTSPDNAYDEITDELLHSLNPPSLPPHSLTLKIGAPIMLIRNLNIKKGLCNGTRLIVTDIKDTLISVKFPNGSETFPIPRIPLIGSDSSLPFNIKRLQFPIRLAFSMTINKSQGQTFDKVAVHLEKPVFAHGQLYVAISRVRKLEDLAVYLGKSTNDPENPITRNVVYPEVVNINNPRN